MRKQIRRFFKAFFIHIDLISCSVVISALHQCYFIAISFTCVSFAYMKMVMSFFIVSATFSCFHLWFIVLSHQPFQIKVLTGLARSNVVDQAGPFTMMKLTALANAQVRGWLLLGTIWMIPKLASLFVYQTVAISKGMVFRWFLRSACLSLKSEVLAQAICSHKMVLCPDLQTLFQPRDTLTLSLAEHRFARLFFRRPEL